MAKIPAFASQYQVCCDVAHAEICALAMAAKRSPVAAFSIPSAIVLNSMLRANSSAARMMCTLLSIFRQVKGRVYR